VNIKLDSSNPFQFHRNPVANSTDAIRGKTGCSTGIHMWKITWPETMRGTHAVIGVSTDQALLQHNGYISLVGFDNESWGWDIVSRKKVHDKQSGNPICSEKYPDMNRLHPTTLFAKHEKIPETIYVILDMFQGTLSYMINDVFLGIAHSNLKGRTLYPSVSAVWGHCEVSINYFNSISADPPSLKSLCLYESRRLLQYHGQYNETTGKQYGSLAISDINPFTDFKDIVSNLLIPNTLKALLLKNNSMFLNL